MKSFIVFVSILYFKTFSDNIECYRFEPNTITLKNYTGCPGDEHNSVHFNQSITQINRNKYVISGEITLKEQINSQIQVFFSAEF